MNAEEKKRDLYLRQKELLAMFPGTWRDQPRAV